MERLKKECGYSLVEVLASIVLLSVAIIPMVAMFDMGLNAATQSSEYDKARALATLKLEQAKSLPYEKVKKHFPDAPPHPADPANDNNCGGGCHRSAKKPGPGTDFAGFEYIVEKQLLDQPPTGPGSRRANVASSGNDEGLMRVTVTVEWDGDKEYSVTGVVAR